MKPDVIERMNGWMSLLRIILPILVTIMLFWIGEIKGDMKDVRHNMTTLTNEYRHELIEIKQRLTAVETQLRFLNALPQDH